MKQVHSLRIAALPAPGKVDVIRVAGGDVQVGIHFHSSSSPGLEVRAMRGLGHMVQQPGGHMTQLMAQCALQLVGRVYNLRAELHT